jgi:pyruvate dehydrogenase E1 component
MLSSELSADIRTMPSDPPACGIPSTEVQSSRVSEDSDPAETREWLEALEGMVQHVGHHRAAYVLNQLELRAQHLGVAARAMPYSAYQNTIALAQQAVHPGDLALEGRITALIRWNALAMVVRANKAYGELGGHLASYASAAEIFETGFNHFFHAGSETRGADLVFFQPHSAPGIYARAFLEGRLSEDQLAHYRQEISSPGLSSYPHPWLMPHFWQFPTGSMGIGPINSIYQARFMRYLEHRKLAVTAGRHVWGVFGDGEMDEPESVAALTLASREKLDNLTFVINCNLQRLDGPVRGNGQITRELEALFTGAGWNVIKVLWGSEWDALFARDRNQALIRRFASVVDGEYQTLGANDGAYNHARFFDTDEELRALVAHMSMSEIAALKRGGHDFRKLYAAFAAARSHRGQPTVILAKTKKGFGMGRAGESRMVAHQEKKLDVEALLEFRDRFELPLSDAEVAELCFVRPPEDSREIRYLKERRSELGGCLPVRQAEAARLSVPAVESYAGFALAAAGKEMSTTMAAVRLLTNLLRDKALGPRIVPIVADEARTFGMSSLFKQIGIYSPVGQLYEPEDAGSLLAYRESKQGQLLEEGITEAGALSSWIAAATAYSVHDLPMLPVYIYYSMFGFQRVGDLIWAAADQRSRGFLLGATSGRTTLGGEGLQHQDGASHLTASTVPNCRAYDPAFACELAVIFDHGMRRMLEEGVDEFYYITLMNENYPQPSLRRQSASGVVKGMYRFSSPEGGRTSSLRLLGSGAILREVIAAAALLWSDWQIAAEVWSVTSFSELAREAREIERWNRLHPQEKPRRSYVAECLSGDTPIIAATDYVCAYPQSIAPYLTARFVALGTDGFGRSDTRDNLRRFFEVDRQHIAAAALHALARSGEISPAIAAAAVERYGIDSATGPPWLK